MEDSTFIEAMEMLLETQKNIAKNCLLYNATDKDQLEILNELELIEKDLEKIKRKSTDDSSSFVGKL